MSFESVVQIVGAVLVLAGFVLQQTGRLGSRTITYLIFNLVGAGMLAVDAAINGQPGFLLLEGVWAVVAGIGLLRRAVTRS